MNFDPIQMPVAEVRMVQKQIEKVLAGSVRIKRGHSLFRLNFTTGILEAVDLSKTPRRQVNKVLPPKAKNEVYLNPTELETTRYSLESSSDCIHFSALNIKSAMKKLKNFGITKFEIVKE